MLMRLAGWFLLLLVVSAIAFALPQLTGVDPVRAVIMARSPDAAPSEETVARLGAALGVHDPLPVRYLRFLRDLVSGDLGLSYTSRMPVALALWRATAISSLVIGAALLVGVVVGMSAGVLAAVRPRRLADRVIGRASRLGIAVPEFILANLLVVVFAIRLHWVRASGWGRPADAILPIVTLAVAPAAMIAQLTRAELRGVLDEPWVRAARAKGMPERRIVRQSLRSSAGSVTALLSLFFPGLLGGTVVIEEIFAIPGLGQLLLHSVLASDLPVAQAGLVMVMLLAMVLSLTADGVRLLIDPRLRVEVRT
ncbi:MAG: ABC transporter permease [Ilumatobacteraceae bacterium]